MQITINLTAVLITLIICAAFCYICKMGKDDKKERREPQKPKDINIPEFLERKRAAQKK